MNIRPALLLLALSLPLAGVSCKKVDLGAPAKLQTGQTVSGEITSSSPLNYNNGSHHRVYEISMQKDQAVALELTGALSGQLSVFDGRSLLARAIDAANGDGEESRRGTVGLAFRAPHDGNYLVAVSGESADAFGPFQLSTTRITPYDGDPLPVAGEITDWMLQDKQQYTLEVEKAGLYTISMDSDVLDSKLALSGKDLEAEDDDGGENLNARIRTYLQPGKYTVSATAVNGNTGEFKLRIASDATDPALAVRDGTALVPGQAVRGVVDSRGRRSFTLELSKVTGIQLDASSDDFDTVLSISGPGVRQEDDDGGAGTNSRLVLGLDPGRYTVTVASLADRQGTFELEATLLDASDLRRMISEAAAEAATAAEAAAAEAE